VEVCLFFKFFASRHRNNNALIDDAKFAACSVLFKYAKLSNYTPEKNVSEFF